MSQLLDPTSQINASESIYPSPTNLMRFICQQLHQICTQSSEITGRKVQRKCISKDVKNRKKYNKKSIKRSKRTNNPRISQSESILGFCEFKQQIQAVESLQNSLQRVKDLLTLLE